MPGHRAESSVNQLPHPPFPEAAVMMTFVNMDSEGLVILPTHRVVHGLPGFDPAGFAKAAEEFFTVSELPATDSCACLELLREVAQFVVGREMLSHRSPQTCSRAAALLLCDHLGRA